jgi:hypothetical protein
MLFGSTAHFTINYDPALPNWSALGNAVLTGCEADLTALENLFQGVSIPAASLPIVINLNVGPGGASHATCASTAIDVYASNSTPDTILGLIDAELAEVFMAVQGSGLNCGYSSGEALSRVVPTILYPQHAYLFSTGNDWLNGSVPSFRYDWVTNNDLTDQHTYSIGCGALFLNYLAHQLNFTWQQIIAASASTLGQMATNLGVANAFQDFLTLLNAHFPGVANELPDDNPFPLYNHPQLYIRHNLADDGSSHSGPLANSPDIIVKNTNTPAALFSTPTSLNSDSESDPYVLDGQTNFLYLRVWNRGTLANNVEAAVYWSAPSTLVTPNMWTHIATGVVNVPVPGLPVTVDELAWDQSTIPGPGHYCFIATVGNAQYPAPNPTTFATFDDFVNYIYANNNITWRNFNVEQLAHRIHGPFEGFIPLPFHITGAWDKPHRFALETIAQLPEGARLALETSHALAAGLIAEPSRLEERHDPDSDADEPRRARIALPAGGAHTLGAAELAPKSAVRSHLLVHIPAEHHGRAHEVAIRQLYAGREVGRITWRLESAKR